MGKQSWLCVLILRCNIFLEMSRPFKKTRQQVCGPEQNILKIPPCHLIPVTNVSFFIDLRKDYLAFRDVLRMF